MPLDELLTAPPSREEVENRLAATSGVVELPDPRRPPFSHFMLHHTACSPPLELAFVTRDRLAD